MHLSLPAPARQMSDEQRFDWLRLIRSDNVGPRTFRSLLEHAGTAARALQLLPDLARRGGARGSLRICSREDAIREIETAEKMGVHFVAASEDGYPPRLETIEDAPPLLAIRGNTDAMMG